MGKATAKLEEIHIDLKAKIQVTGGVDNQVLTLKEQECALKVEGLRGVETEVKDCVAIVKFYLKDLSQKKAVVQQWFRTLFVYEAILSLMVYEAILGLMESWGYEACQSRPHVVSCMASVCTGACTPGRG